MEEEEQQEEQERQEEEEVEAPTERPAEKPAERKVSFPTTRRERRKVGRIGRKRLVFVIVAVVLAAAGWFIFGRQKEDVAPEITFEPAVEEATPTPTSEPVEKGNLRIQVLNGTGIAKEASFLQGELGDLGYTKVDVGNADNEDYVATEVTFSSGLSREIRDEITNELGGIYQEVDTKTSDTLDDLDIRVITGYRKGHTPTPTPTTAPTSTPTPTATQSATPTSSPTPTLP